MEQRCDAARKQNINMTSWGLHAPSWTAVFLLQRHRRRSGESPLLSPFLVYSMPAARFGASKFRNAVRHIPPREEWYRGALPPAISSSSISSSTSTFSSEVKTNREWVVTLSPAGELSYRGYEALAGQEKVGVVKGLGGGGGVGDWDLSKLEDGSIAVGGLDGSVSHQCFHLPCLSVLKRTRSRYTDYPIYRLNQLSRP